MTNKIDVEGVVEKILTDITDCDGEQEVREMLVDTLTTLLNQAEEEKQRAVEEERKRIREDLRRVYFDIITSCCDECALGSKFNCGGCGGTRRPSNASCGEPLDKYLKLWKK